MTILTESPYCAGRQPPPLHYPVGLGLQTEGRTGNGGGPFTFLIGEYSMARGRDAIGRDLDQTEKRNLHAAFVEAVKKRLPA